LEFGSCCSSPHIWFSFLCSGKNSKMLFVDDYDWKVAAYDKVFTIQVRVSLWCPWTRRTFSVEQSTTYYVLCHILSAKFPQQQFALVHCDWCWVRLQQCFLPCRALSARAFIRSCNIFQHTSAAALETHSHSVLRNGTAPVR
jgi:hypothetical protein